jgi:hypothetical protein
MILRSAAPSAGVRMRGPVGGCVVGGLRTILLQGRRTYRHWTSAQPPVRRHHRLGDRLFVLKTRHRESGRHVEAELHQAAKTRCLSPCGAIDCILLTVTRPKRIVGEVSKTGHEIRIALTLPRMGVMGPVDASGVPQLDWVQMAAPCSCLSAS